MVFVVYIVPGCKPVTGKDEEKCVGVEF